MAVNSTKSNNIKAKISPRQSQALIMKLLGKTHAQIGKALNVSKQTVDSWSIQTTFKDAYEALTLDLEARSLNVLQTLRTESEQMALEAIQVIKTAIGDPKLKPSEKLQFISEAARWFSLLHPEPRGIAISASANAGDTQAHSTVFVYQGEPTDEQRESLTTGSDMAVWLPDNGRDAIDVTPH